MPLQPKFLGFKLYSLNFLINTSLPGQAQIKLECSRFSLSSTKYKEQSFPSTLLGISTSNKPSNVGIIS